MGSDRAGAGDYRRVELGCHRLFGFDLVAFICGGQMAVLSRVIYTVVGIAGLWCVSLLFRENVTGEATA